MNSPIRKVLFIFVGCAAAATLAVSALFGVIGSTPRAGVTPPSQPPVVRPTLTPAPSATSTPSPSVTLALASVDRQPSLGGITTTIVIENHRTSLLSFSFDPSYDLRLADASGKTWPLRWAEYDGAPKVAAGTSRQLARAFFAGPISNDSSWPLTISVERVPAVGKVEWQIPQSGRPTPPFKTSALQAIPTVAPTGPISLTLANPQPSSGLGGIQVDLMIKNDRESDLVFHFDPNAQISAEDNLRRPYQVRWAQYDGTVHVGPHATARLARVFFEGPIGDGRGTSLTVELYQVPGARSLQNVVQLQ